MTSLPDVYSSNDRCHPINNESMNKHEEYKAELSRLEDILSINDQLHKRFLEEFTSGQRLYKSSRSNKYVLLNILSDELLNEGSNLEDYYYINTYGRRPICNCPDCNNPVEFKSLKLGSSLFCRTHSRYLSTLRTKVTCTSQKFRTRMSDVAIEKFKDPEQHKKLSEACIRKYANKEARDKTSESQINSYANNPTRREKLSAGLVAAHKDPIKSQNYIFGQNKPETKLKKSNSSRLAWITHRDTLEKTILNGRRGRKSKLYSADDNSDVYFDSSWERSFFLNISTKLDIISIKRRVGFTISYYIPDEEVLLEQGVEIIPHNYTPDFLLELTNGEIWVVEIKPLKDMDDIIVQSKIKYAVPYCQNLGYRYVIFNDDLTTPHFYC